jgi:protein-S-isoprenylcysteine O-methyltransferase Ste14
MKLALQTLASAAVGVVFFGAALFLPAMTLKYWQAWVFIVVFMLVTMVPSMYLAVTDPAALRRRMRAGPTAETRPIQRFVMTATLLSVLATLVVSAFDHRFGWSGVPVPVVIVGDVLVAGGILLTQLVIIQNSYAAATIRVESGQTLTSTGLYGVVRHPMYTGALIMMVGTPLALDSYWGLIAVACAVPVLAVRIRDEESMLRDDLDGYLDYMAQVRYRLVPYVW